MESARAELGLLPTPNQTPACRGLVSHFKICRKRASPQRAGEGLGVGVRQRITARPPPRRSAAKLAQAAQACLRAPTLPTRGRVKTEFAARAESTSPECALLKALV